MSQLNFDNYMECSLSLAVDLVNTFDPTDGTEDLPTIGALSEFVSEHQVSYQGRVTSQDLEQVRRLRARLRRVFDAPNEETAAGILNKLLAYSGARPELTSHGGDDWHLHYTASDAPLARRLMAEAAMALSVLVAADGFERLRVCEAGNCIDVFVDQSRNRSRRFCSPQVCGNRASVAAFRARQREKATG